VRSDDRRRLWCGIISEHGGVRGAVRQRCVVGGKRGNWRDVLLWAYGRKKPTHEMRIQRGAESDPDSKRASMQSCCKRCMKDQKHRTEGPKQSCERNSQHVAAASLRAVARSYARRVRRLAGNRRATPPFASCQSVSQGPFRRRGVDPKPAF
jgi:hypothetical protein